MKMVATTSSLGYIKKCVTYLNIAKLNYFKNEFVSCFPHHAARKFPEDVFSIVLLAMNILIIMIVYI